MSALNTYLHFVQQHLRIGAQLARGFQLDRETFERQRDMPAQHLSEPGAFATGACFVCGDDCRQRLAPDHDWNGERGRTVGIERRCVRAKLCEPFLACKHRDAIVVGGQTVRGRDQRFIDRSAVSDLLEDAHQSTDQRPAARGPRRLEHLRFFPGEGGVFGGEPFVLVNDLRLIVAQAFDRRLKVRGELGGGGLELFLRRLGELVGDGRQLREA